MSSQSFEEVLNLIGPALERRSAEEQERARLAQQTLASTPLPKEGLVPGVLSGILRGTAGATYGLGELVGLVPKGTTKTIKEAVSESFGEEDTYKSSLAFDAGELLGELVPLIVGTKGLGSATKLLGEGASAMTATDEAVSITSKLYEISPALGKAFSSILKATPKIVQTAPESFLAEVVLSDNPSPKGAVGWLVLDSVFRARMFPKFFDKIFKRQLNLRGPVTDIWDPIERRWFREGDLQETSGLVMDMVKALSGKSGVDEGRILHHLMGSPMREAFGPETKLVIDSRVGKGVGFVFEDGKTVVVNDSLSAVNVTSKLLEGKKVVRVVGSKRALNNFRFDFLSQTPDDLEVVGKIANEVVDAGPKAVFVTKYTTGGEVKSQQMISLKSFLGNKELAKAIRNGEAEIASVRNFGSDDIETIIDHVWEPKSTYKVGDAYVLPTILKPRATLEDGTVVTLSGNKAEIQAQIAGRKIKSIRLPMKIFYDEQAKKQYAREILGLRTPIEPRSPASPKTPATEIGKEEVPKEEPPTTAPKKEPELIPADELGVVVRDPVVIKTDVDKIIDRGVRRFLAYLKLQGTEIPIPYRKQLRPIVGEAVEKALRPGANITAEEADALVHGVVLGMVTSAQRQLPIFKAILDSRVQLAEVMGAGELFRTVAFLQSLPENLLKAIKLTELKVLNQPMTRRALMGDVVKEGRIYATTELLQSQGDKPIGHLIKVYQGANSLDFLEELWHVITGYLPNDALREMYAALPKRFQKANVDVTESLAKVGVAWTLGRIAEKELTPKAISWLSKLGQALKSVYENFFARYFGRSKELEEILPMIKLSKMRKTPRTWGEIAKAVGGTRGPKYPVPSATQKTWEGFFRDLGFSKVKVGSIQGKGSKHWLTVDLTDGGEHGITALKTLESYFGIEFNAVERKGSSKLVDYYLGDTLAFTVNKETGVIYAKRGEAGFALVRDLLSGSRASINLNVQRSLPTGDLALELEEFVLKSEAGRYKQVAQTFHNLLQRMLPPELGELLRNISYTLNKDGQLEIDILRYSHQRISEALGKVGLALDDIVRVAKKKAAGVERDELSEAVVDVVAKAVAKTTKGKQRAALVRIDPSLKDGLKIVTKKGRSQSTRRFSTTLEGVKDFFNRIKDKGLDSIVRVEVKDPDSILALLTPSKLPKTQTLLIHDGSIDGIIWYMERPNGRIVKYRTEGLFQEGRRGVLPAEIRQEIHTYDSNVRVVHGSGDFSVRSKKGKVTPGQGTGLLDAIDAEKRHAQALLQTLGLDREAYITLEELKKRTGAVVYFEQEHILVRFPEGKQQTFKTVDEAIGALRQMDRDLGDDAVVMSLSSEADIPPIIEAARELHDDVAASEEIPGWFRASKDISKGIAEFFSGIYSKILQPMRGLASEIQTKSGGSIKTFDYWRELHFAKKAYHMGIYEDVKDIIPKIRKLSKQSQQRVMLAIRYGLGREGQLQTELERDLYNQVVRGLNLSKEELAVGEAVAKWFDEMGEKYIFKHSFGDVEYILRYDPFKDLRHVLNRKDLEAAIKEEEALRRALLNGEIPTNTIFQKRTNQVLLSGAKVNLDSAVFAYAANGNRGLHLQPLLEGGQSMIQELRRKGLRKPHEYLAVEALESMMSSVTNAMGHHGAYIYATLEETLRWTTGRSDLAQTFVSRLLDLGYMAAIGFRPATALKNNLQHILTGTVLGRKMFTAGLSDAIKALSGKDPNLLKLLDPVFAEWASPIEEAIYKEVSKLAGGGAEVWSRVKNASMYFMRKTEMLNRSAAFFGGIRWGENIVRMWRAEGKEAIPKIINETPMAILREAEYLRLLNLLEKGEEVQFIKEFGFHMVANTQWIYGPGEASLVGNAKIGRLFLMFGTWPGNYIDFVRRIMHSAAAEGGLKMLTGKSWGSQMLRRWVVYNAALYSSLGALGVGASGLTFLGPAQYYGGPYVDLAVGLRDAMQFSQNSKARSTERAFQKLTKAFIPGAALVYDMNRAMRLMRNDEALLGVLRFAGFSPTDKDLRRLMAGLPVKAKFDLSNVEIQ